MFCDQTLFLPNDGGVNLSTTRYSVYTYHKKIILLTFKFFFQIRDGVGRPRVYLKIIFFFFFGF
jgi:hypothetical protein